MKKSPQKDMENSSAFWFVCACLSGYFWVHKDYSLEGLLLTGVFVIGFLWTGNTANNIREHKKTHGRTVPAHVKALVRVRDGGRCRKCGSTNNLQYDHIRPYSWGGRSDEASNIQLLCASCNRRKSNNL